MAPNPRESPARDLIDVPSGTLERDPCDIDLAEACVVDASLTARSLAVSDAIGVLAMRWELPFW
jgi:hypothetical protein